MRTRLKQFHDTVARAAAGGKRRPVAPGEAGLTLVEMMVVLVIIAIVATLITVNVINRPDQAKVTTTQSNLLTISGALKMYRLDNGDYPTTDQGLKALVEKPTAAPVPSNWAQGGYLPENPVDAWGNPYVYTNQGGSFTLKSLGKDGKPGGEGLDADLEAKRS